MAMREIVMLMNVMHVQDLAEFYPGQQILNVPVKGLKRLQWPDVCPEMYGIHGLESHQ